MPPLRHRIDDIPIVVSQVLARLTGSRETRASPAAMRVICRYSWPRNIHQLEEALRAALIKRPAGDLQPKTCQATATTRLAGSSPAWSPSNAMPSSRPCMMLVATECMPPRHSGSHGLRFTESSRALESPRSEPAFGVRLIANLEPRPWSRSALVPGRSHIRPGAGPRCHRRRPRRCRAGSSPVRGVPR